VKVGPAIFSVFIVAAAILVWSGFRKLHDPGPASHALSAVGLPSAPLLVRIVGVVEAATGASCLIGTWRLAASVSAVLYLSFAGFVLYLRTRPGFEDLSCGCLGKRSLRPSYTHVAINVASAGSATAVAWQNGPSFGELWRSQPWPLLYLLSLVTMAGVVWGLGTYFSELFFVYHSSPRTQLHRHLTAEEAFVQAGIPFDHPSLWGGWSFGGSSVQSPPPEPAEGGA